ncbi:MAG: helix-turn-helix domain-containing protein [Aristaeellaceae bacterium]
MSVCRQEFCDGYAFHFLDNIEHPAVRLISVGYEERCCAAYHWDNAQRAPGVVLQYTLRGSGRVRAGSQLYRAEPGSAFLLSFPADNAYYFDEQECTAPWAFYYVVFSGEAVAPYVELVSGRQGTVFPLSEQHPAVRRLMNLYAQARENQLHDPFTAASQVFAILCALCAIPEEPRARSRLTEEAIGHMQSGFAQSIGIADVAAALQVSASHLSRVFYRDTGLHPVAYLTRLRLEEAVRLLNTTNLSIDTISSRCGFSDGNYFSKVFRCHMGLSPRAFRQQLQSQQYRSIRL